jgi:hypothetical protein
MGYIQALLMLLMSESQLELLYQMSRSLCVMLYLRFRKHPLLSMFLFENVRNLCCLLRHQMQLV